MLDSLQCKRQSRTAKPAKIAKKPLESGAARQGKRNVALPFLAGKSLNTKDTKYTKGEKGADFTGVFPS